MINTATMRSPSPSPFLLSLSSIRTILLSIIVLFVLASLRLQSQLISSSCIRNNNNNKSSGNNQPYSNSVSVSVNDGEIRHAEKKQQQTEAAIPTEATAAAKQDELESYLQRRSVDTAAKERMDRIQNIYMAKYKYHPPAIMTNESSSLTTAATTTTSSSSSAQLFSHKNFKCGMYPDFMNFFGLNVNYRSRYKEDKIIYDTFFKDDVKSNIIHHFDDDHYNEIYYDEDDGRANGDDAILDKDEDENGSNIHKNDHKTTKRTIVVDSIPHNTYVEIGGYDGLSESNTNFFDTCLHWNGLLIEGNPGSGIYDKLVTNRPNAHRMNYVPSCNKTEELDSSSNTIPFYSTKYANTGIEAQDQGVNTKYGGKVDFLNSVPCGTLTQVLLDVFPPHGRISFFSLDVEGSEHLVLGKAIDLNRVFIEMFLIEVENSLCVKGQDCVSRNNVRRIMKDANYARFSNKIRESDVFIRRDSNLLAKAHKARWKESS